jgi:tRNA pseudouridine-54 N-methylase
MKTKKNIYDLHEDNKTWLSSLTFYKDDLLLMQKRIEEVAKKHNSKEVLASIEHFQNQLIVQKEQLDILTHDVRGAETTLEKAVNKNATAIDHQHFPAQVALAERVQTFEKIFKDLRNELGHFLSKYM